MLSRELEIAIGRILAGPATAQHRELARLCDTHPAQAQAIHEHATALLGQLRPSDQPTERPSTRSILSRAGREERPDDEAPLVAGTVLAGRYRIEQLLGRGGMGQVYRANDLTLGIPVAIKTLPASVHRSRRRLELFRAEVRLARRVTHPNICRVHDIGESHDRTFLSMELVDGEDLASRLQRENRLPYDQAVGIARQLCTALAALHEQRLVHRDLKPGNVLIDQDGRAKLADFGVATTAGQTRATGLVGTPLYMAPEQLRGQPATASSDLYALGLVLYELFSGTRLRDEQSSDPTDPLNDSPPRPRPISDFVDEPCDDIDRIIASCLQDDPLDRPDSAFAVLASLPGGDPLRAVLEANQTPSPDLVAAAGESKRLSRPVAALLLFAALCCMPIETAIKELHSMHRAVPLDRSPQELVGQARDILHWLGHDTEPGDHYSVSGFRHWGARNVVRQELPGAPTGRADVDARIRELLGSRFPPTFRTVYIESSDYLTDAEKTNPYVRSPPSRSGSAAVAVSHHGDLFWLRVAASSRLSRPSETPTRSDADLLERAGLDPDNFSPTEPRTFAAGIACDQRTAWRGSYPNLPDFPIRVEIARLDGHVVAFEVLEDRPPDPASVSAPTRFEASAISIAQTAYGLVFLLTAAGALGIAYGRWRDGRGDTRGARRLAGVVFVLMMARWALTTHHAPSAWQELGPFQRGLADATQSALMAFVLYLAGEPFIRRYAPKLLTSWVRLFSGRARDPAVGRDLLIGMAFASAYKFSELVFKTDWSDPWRYGSGLLSDIPVARMTSTTHALGITAMDLVEAVVQASLTLFAAVLVIRLCRWRRLGIFVSTAILIVAARWLFGYGNGFGATLAATSFGILAMTAALRFGLLALASSFATALILNSTPATLDLTSWYLPSFLADLTVLTGMAFIGHHVARAPR